jgi:hypothetical protein
MTLKDMARDEVVRVCETPLRLCFGTPSLLAFFSRASALPFA